MTTVHAALGEPPWLSIVPRDRHSWRAREHFLIFSLPLHLRTWRLRSWRTLWCFLHWEEPPHQEPSWASLCCDTTLLTLSDTLEVALKGDSSSGFFSWNVRYLKDLHTSTNLSSKAVIQRHLTTQRICFLQETHWTANDIVNWGSAFPFSTICATPGRSNREGTGNQGGVAIILPPRFTLVSSRILADGFAIEATFRGPNEEHRRTCWSMYLPPQERHHTLNAISANKLDRSFPTIGADLNTNCTTPRSTEGAAIAHGWATLLHRVGSKDCEDPGKTWRNATSSSSIDRLAGPEYIVSPLTCSKTWNNDLSDHAGLTPQRGPVQRPRIQPCNPRSIRTLPPEAFTDLRRRFRRLELRFNITGDEIAPDNTDSNDTKPTPTNHDAHTTNRQELHGPDDDAWAAGGINRGGPAPLELDTITNEHIRYNEDLARNGATWMASEVASWWQTWSKKRRTCTRNIPAELRKAATTEAIHIPTQDLAEWMTSVDKDANVESLTATEAKQWLALTHTLQSSAKRHQCPTFLAGPSAVRHKRSLHHLVGVSIHKPRLAAPGVKD